VLSWFSSSGFTAHNGRCVTVHSFNTEALLALSKLADQERSRILEIREGRASEAE